VAYKLDNPEQSKVHPMFHVSQLKACLGPGRQVLSQLPHPDATHQIPNLVLQRHVRQRDLGTIVQVLVQWSGSPAEDATWEDLDSLKQQFPRAPAWGQAGIQDPGNVSDQDLSTMATSPNGELDLKKGAGGRPKRIRRAPNRLAGHVLG